MTNAKHDDIAIGRQAAVRLWESIQSFASSTNRSSVTSSSRAGAARRLFAIPSLS